MFHLEASVAEAAGARDGCQEAEGPPGAELRHDETAEQAAGPLPDPEEEAAHEAHHAGQGGGRADLRHVGHGRGHHQRHGEPLQRLVRVDVHGVAEVAVADHAHGVGDHAEDDDVDVPHQVGDGAAEHEEGEGGHHADGDGPAHLKLARADVVQEPEEETLNEAPEAAGEHHHDQEYDHFEISQNISHVRQHLFSRRFKVEPSGIKATDD